jgi:hypothetical protein
MKRAVTSLYVSAAMVIAGCSISVNDFAGKTCAAAEDCPEPYVCVAVRTGAGRTCESLGLPEVDGGTGPQLPDGGGAVPTWCEVQPVFLANCVSGCHGDSTDGSGRRDFRLDFYEANLEGIKGAKEMAERIKLRTYELRTMPPEGNPAPTDAERELVARWAAGGAPGCEGSPGGAP